MQCPTCRDWKPRKAWTASQYEGYRTTREDHRGRIVFDGCTECFAKAATTRKPSPERWTLRDAQGMPGFKISKSEGDAEPAGGMRSDVRMLADLLTAAWHHQVEDYVEKGMLRPERDRKAWSHVGAVFSRDESDPVDDMATGTFNPSNWCYDKTVKLLCPDSWAISWRIAWARR